MVRYFQSLKETKKSARLKYFHKEWELLRNKYKLCRIREMFGSPGQIRTAVRGSRDRYPLGDRMTINFMRKLFRHPTWPLDYGAAISKRNLYLKLLKVFFAVRKILNLPFRETLPFLRYCEATFAYRRNCLQQALVNQPSRGRERVFHRQRIKLALPDDVPLADSVQHFLLRFC